MNCCTYDCHQGDHCPARKCQHCYGIGYDASGYPCTCQPTKVARVGKRMHGKAALPSNPWRAYLRHLAKWMLAFTAIGVVFGFGLSVRALT